MTIKELYKKDPVGITAMCLIKSGACKQLESAILTAKVYMYIYEKNENVQHIGVTGSFVTPVDIAKHFSITRAQAKYATYRLRGICAVDFVYGKYIAPYYKVINPEKFIERFEG